MGKHNHGKPQIMSDSEAIAFANEVYDLLITKDYKMTALRRPFVTVDDIQGGWCRYATARIKLAQWKMCTIPEYAKAHIIHEVCHLVDYDRSFYGPHGAPFKEVETVILKHYGWKPVYSRAYKKALLTLDGKKICGRYGEPAKEPIIINRTPVAADKARKPLSNKAVVYNAWKCGQTDAEFLHRLVNNAVKATTIRGWLSAWKRGRNLPANAK